MAQAEQPVEPAKEYNVAFCVHTGPARSEPEALGEALALAFAVAIADTVAALENVDKRVSEEKIEGDA